jgi:hypothetical protein
MRHIFKNDCTFAYVALSLLVAIFLVLFVAAMHGQELPNAPQPAVKQRISPEHKHSPHAEKPRNLDTHNLELGSADWFRERNHFKLARVMPLFKAIDWHLSFGKPMEAGHGSHSSRMAR